MWIFYENGDGYYPVGWFYAINGDTRDMYIFKTIEEAEAKVHYLNGGKSVKQSDEPYTPDKVWETKIKTLEIEYQEMRSSVKHLGEALFELQAKVNKSYEDPDYAGDSIESRLEKLENLVKKQMENGE